MKHYYERMRDLREDHDLKQSQLAEILNLTNQQSYQRYESGRVQMPIHLLIKLAQYYKVSLDYLCCLTDNKEKFW